MYYYAQIDENNIVVGISQLKGEVDKSNMLRIDSYNEDLLGTKWNGKNFKEIKEEK